MKKYNTDLTSFSSKDIYEFHKGFDVNAINELRMIYEQFMKGFESVDFLTVNEFVELIEAIQVEADRIYYED